MKLITKFKLIGLLRLVILLLPGLVHPHASAASPDLKPIGLIVDAMGGIYWARAPTGYYTGDNAKALRNYTKSAGLENSECPLFAVSQSVLVASLQTMPSSEKDDGRRKMKFIFVFLFSDSPPVKYLGGKHELQEVIAKLPPEVTERLKDMYRIADRFNNPSS